MTRGRWPGIARGIFGRLLIYGAIVPLALYLAFPALPEAWALWRSGALTESPPAAPSVHAVAPPPHAVVPPAPSPHASAPPAAPMPADDRFAQQASSKAEAAREADRRQLVMMLVAELDHCRRAGEVLRNLCDANRYANRTRPAFMTSTCEALPDFGAAIERAEAAYREVFPAPDVDAALALSRESFEAQFAGPLRHEFSGSDVETLDRIVHERCEVATDPELLRRLRTGDAQRRH